MRRVVTGLIAGAGIAGAIFLTNALAAEADEQLAALAAEVKALKEGQAAMLEQLAAIQDLLANSRPQSQTASTDAETKMLQAELKSLREAVARYRDRDEQARLAQMPVRDSDFTLQVGDDPFKGSADAQLTLVEFTDYQCPYCGRHNKNTVPQLIENYVDTGKLRYVVRDYPLSFHKHALKASEAAHCAGEQGVYWEMHEQLFANQGALMAEKLPEYAEAAGVGDMATFQSCLDSGQYTERANESLAEGAKAGVSGTPSFLLGSIEPDGTTFKAMKFIRGAQQYSVFREAIEEILSPAEG